MPSKKKTTNKKKGQPKEIQIHVPENIRAGAFSNLASINATNTEVTIDFAHIPPAGDEGMLVGRIILTPEHAIKFKDVLVGVLDKHAQKEK